MESNRAKHKGSSFEHMMSRRERKGHDFIRFQRTAIKNLVILYDTRYAAPRDIMEMRGRCIFSETKEQPERWLLSQRAVYSEPPASLF
jgi:hypothetical protein